MKIAVCSHGPERNHIDAYGGLELRFVVNWAQFLREEGYDVHFFDPERVGCDESFDLALGCLMERCENVRAKHHIHCSFNTCSLGSPEVQNSKCYKQGKYYYANPYRVDYLKSLGMRSSQGYAHHPVFMPLPYSDKWLPNNLIPGFQRAEVAWANKGNFAWDFGPECRPEYVENGLRTLRALVRLSKKADFKVTFLLDSHIRGHRGARAEYALQIEDLIAQLPRAERLDVVPWSQVVSLLGRCKLNTHAGGLTSAINEAIFTHGVPVTPSNFIHLSTVDLLPSVLGATEDQIYDVYERLWFDEKFYNQIYGAFQDHFRDHRTDGVRKAWGNLLDQLDLR